MKPCINLLFVVAVLVSCNEPLKKNIEEKGIQPKKNVKIVKSPAIETDTSNMIFFKGGTILIGSNNGASNEKPTFEKEIDSFYLDKNLVTVAEFRKFIRETGHLTEADTFGDSGVFLFDQGQWTLLKGANWEFPLGRSQPKATDNHPVTQVSWNDARAFAKWAGKRLPTEFEWEYAAKNGKNNSQKYAWGNKPVINGKYMANVWQGNSLTDTIPLDGYLLTSPVGAFGETESGLTDMGGNVWEWCDTIYESYPGSEIAIRSNPNIRSTRGGSFMFDQALENSYSITFRSSNTIDTSLFNTGFRCAK